MEINLKEGKFKVDPIAGEGTIKSFLRALFWLSLAALLGALFMPKAAASWLKKAVDYADEAWDAWEPKLKGWGRWLVNHVRTWGQFLLDGSLRLVSATLIISAFLLLFYTAGLAYAGPFAVAMAVPIGILVLVATSVVNLLPRRLFPNKGKLKDVVGIIGMWPIAIAVLIATLDIRKLGEGAVAVLLLVVLFYLIRGGDMQRARKVALAVLWFGIVFHSVKVGLPALETGVAGGWAKEMASHVSFWDTERDKAADILRERELVYSQRTFGVATDTIDVVLLPTYANGNVTLGEIATSILPQDVLEILTDEKAAAWGAEFNDPLLAALGDTAKHARAAAKRGLGFVDVSLVAFKDPGKRRVFELEHGSVAFYVPWGSVSADAKLTAQNGQAATPRGEEVPRDFSLTGTVNGRRVGGSVSIRDTVGTVDEDGWITVVYNATKNPVIRIPLKTQPGDIVEFEYLDGTVAHSRLPDGSQDPKYHDRNGYHYAHDVGPSGYEPDQTMGQSWQLAQTQLLNQGAPYMSLQVGTSPSNVDLRTVFAYGESYATVEVAKPGSYLYLAFNDAFYDRNWSGSAATYLQSQCNRRIGWIKFRVRIAPAYDADADSDEEYEELGYASRRR